MSKVEELRAYVIAHCLTIDPHEAVDSLIAAARAEGAEQTKAEIRKAATHYASGDPIEGGDAETLEGNEAYAERECYIVEAVLLFPAPKEEK